MEGKVGTHSTSANLRAGMLPLVVMISTLITLSCTALVGLAHYQGVFRTQDRIAQQLRRNAHSGINILSADGETHAGRIRSLDLYGEGRDSIRMSRRWWGLWDLGVVEATRGSHRHRIAVLFGCRPDSIARSSLYLPDENRPLSVSGDTRLHGRLYLPQGVVRTACVGGRGFSGTMPRPGTIHGSGKRMPALPASLTRRARYYRAMPGRHRPLDGLPASSRRSFQEATLVYAADGDALIEQDVSGNVVLLGKQTLVISQKARLKDVVVVARKVVVEAGFTGTLQILARDTLEVEAGCRFGYPSVLYAGGGSGACHIKIGEGSLAEGLVMAGSEVSYSLANRVEIGAGALVRGQVFVKGMVELRGAVHGNLTTQRLFLVAPAALYENHLLDAEIDVTKRPRSFLTSPALSGTDTDILQWLY